MEAQKVEADEAKKRVLDLSDKAEKLEVLKVRTFLQDKAKIIENRIFMNFTTATLWYFDTYTVHAS